jgi:ribose transport system ATP-binding protein
MATGILIAAIVVALLVFGLTSDGFLTQQNLFNVAEQTAVISLVAFGMTAVIVTRGIDLSVGSSLAFAGVLGGKVLHATGGSAPATIATVLLAAVALGCLNGFLVSVLRVNAFMATLGTYALAKGAAISISSGASVDASNGAITWLGRAEIGRVPVSAILTVVVLAAFHWLMRRTLLGRWFYAQGGNRNAAVATGIPVRRVEFAAYAITGLVVGIGSLLTIGRVHSIQPLAGSGLEFSAITAAVIGGTSLAGGRGNVVNTFLGSIFVGIISAGLSFLGVDQSLIYVFTGILVVLAVLLSQRSILQTLRERVAVASTAVRRRISGRGARPTIGAGSGDRHRLEVVNVQKRFSGVVALKSVSFDLHSGEVVALMGENGAGKSTLVKILAGNHRASAGEVLIDGQPAQFTGPEDARRSGIAVIHQHFTLVPDLTVAENLFLGQEPRLWGWGPLSRRRMRGSAHELLRELEIPVGADTRISDLSVGHKQMIEIAKAVREKAWLVIMDEPTSALSSRERDHLYAFIDRLRERSTAVLYISHKLDEIYHLASRAVVLRDGIVAGTPQLADVDRSALVNMMVGRPIENLFPYAPARVGGEALVVVGVSDGGVLREVSLTVRRGEVVGLAGLMGSGRTELMRCIVGLSSPTAGTIQALGRSVAGLSIGDLAELGVAYVPEDRHDEGIFPELTVAENMSMLWIRRHSAAGLLRVRGEKAAVRRGIENLGVRPPDPRREIRFLSGGNQQKVVLGKWLALSPQLVLLDDPTRGVDVGAKAEIHRLVAQLKSEGAAVLLTSSEMPEVLSVSDRVIVMRHGRSVAEYDRGATEEQVMRDAFGEEDADRRAEAGPVGAQTRTEPETGVSRA